MPASIGPYRIRREIGRGGMGVVYEAEQQKPQRTVALKTLPPGWIDSEGLRRLAGEAEVLGLLRHPDIASVYAAGTYDPGSGEVPYFAMEFVPGQPLGDYVRNNQLDVAAIVALVARICEAVHHAHERGVIHRDLKLANVVVTDPDKAGASGRPVILDFGIARTTASAAQRTTTHTGQLLGTPAYMSPEQIGGSAASIDPRTDVYSLGVMLYELLAEQLPLDVEGRSIREIARIVENVQPTRLGRIRPDCRGDLETICGKALAKERELRYGSAAEFAQDLRRFLAHQPILARPQTTWYHIRKFTNRNRALVAGACAIFILLVAGIVTAVMLMTRANRGETAAETYRSKLAGKLDEFDQLSGVLQLEKARTRVATLVPPWPELEPELKQWLETDWQQLTEARTAATATVAKLAAQQQAATDPDSNEVAAARFLHDTLSLLLADIDAAETLQKRIVERRLTWARSMHAWAGGHRNARVTWAAVRDDVDRNPPYAGQEIPLAPDNVWGLVPLGRNPVTNLHEFYHLRSAWDGQQDPNELPIPVHEADGSIALSGDTGIVFVLLPGTTTDIVEPPLYASLARPTDPTETVLEPFLIARHELTQAQWARLWDGDPSRARPSAYFPGRKMRTWAGSFEEHNPVESVSWWESTALLKVYGLDLPTGVEWEYACRGGTTTPFSCAADELQKYANVADQSAKEAGAPWPTETWNDGYVPHAPVATFLPNPYGLFDVHGNVSEWCKDVFERDKGAPLRRRAGGTFSHRSSSAMSKDRHPVLPESKRSTIGLRAARRLRP